MKLKDMVKTCRSYRRFYQDRPISGSVLEELVDMARITASGRNAQPLKYVVTNSQDMCSRLFPTLAWAGYLKDWDGPQEGERPTAYIVICNDTDIAPDSLRDQGIAAQTILIGAVESGLGGCMIGAFRKDVVSEVLGLPANLVPVLVIALGVPKETVVLTEAGAGGDIKYYRDEQGIHYVPKRPLKEVLIKK